MGNILKNNCMNKLKMLFNKRAFDSDANVNKRLNCAFALFTTITH